MLFQQLPVHMNFKKHCGNIKDVGAAHNRQRNNNSLSPQGKAAYNMIHRQAKLKRLFNRKINSNNTTGFGRH